MPQLCQEFNEGVANTKEIIAGLPDAAEKERHARQLDEIKTEGEKAVRTNDKTLLVSVNERLRELAERALHSDPGTWLYHFRMLTSGKNNFMNEREAVYFIEKGKRAIEIGDVEELKKSCRGLLNLLPIERQTPMRINTSGITR
jgi:hypothetical protein